MSDINDVIKNSLVVYVSDVDVFTALYYEYQYIEDIENLPLLNKIEPALLIVDIHANVDLKFAMLISKYYQEIRDVFMYDLDGLSSLNTPYIGLAYGIDNGSIDPTDIKFVTVHDNTNGPCSLRFRFDNIDEMEEAISLINMSSFYIYRYLQDKNIITKFKGRGYGTNAITLKCNNGKIVVDQGEANIVRPSFNERDIFTAIANQIINKNIKNTTKKSKNTKVSKSSNQVINKNKKSTTKKGKNTKVIKSSNKGIDKNIFTITDCDVNYSDIREKIINNDIRNIKLSKKITEIPSYAFFQCNTITNIDLPSSLEFIGDHAFRECTNLESISIPHKIDCIERETFWACLNLTKVVLPRSLKTIEEKAFSGCVSLPSIKIPNGTERIEDGAFWGDQNLREITIPYSVSHIGNKAFADCDLLNIKCVKGTYAEEYAKDNHISYSYIYSKEFNEIKKKERIKKRQEEHNQRKLEKKLEKEKRKQAAIDKEEYSLKYNEWKKEVEKARFKVISYITKSVEEEKTRRLQELESKYKYNIKISNLNTEIYNLEKELLNFEDSLNKLGVFKFKEKDSLKNSIEITKKKIADTKENLEKTQVFYDDKINKLNKDLCSIKNEYIKKAFELYEIPNEPEKPNSMLTEIEKKIKELPYLKANALNKSQKNRDLRKIFLVLMKNREPLTINEIVSKDDYLRRTSYGKMSALLSFMVSDKIVDIIVIKKRNSFMINDECYYNILKQQLKEHYRNLAFTIEDGEKYLNELFIIDNLNEEQLISKAKVANLI